MLAETLDFPGNSGSFQKGKWKFSPWPKDYKFPYLGWWMSEKYDGVRAIWDGKQFYSRTGQIYHAPKWFTDSMPRSIGLDGEFFGGNHKFAETSGTVRRKDSGPEWKNISFMAFDLISSDSDTLPYSERYELVKGLVQEAHKRKSSWIKLVTQIPITSTSQLYQFYQKVLESGGEGIVIRNPKAHYEHKRSKNLIKFKPIHDQEAVVTGFVEGRGKYKGVLGAFQVEMLDYETKQPLRKYFNLSGQMSNEFRSQYKFDHGQIQHYPKKSTIYPTLGSVVTYEYMSFTKDGLPRQPIFLRLRSDT